jgi:hypothetical protein
MMVVVFRVLVSQDATIAEVKVAGENGANTKLGGKADDREGGRFDANLTFALAFTTATEGKAFRPAEVFGVVVGD